MPSKRIACHRILKRDNNINYCLPRLQCGSRERKTGNTVFNQEHYGFKFCSDHKTSFVAWPKCDVDTKLTSSICGQTVASTKLATKKTLKSITQIVPTQKESMMFLEQWDNGFWGSTSFQFLFCQKLEALQENWKGSLVEQGIAYYSKSWWWITDYSKICIQRSSSCEKLCTLYFISLDETFHLYSVICNANCISSATNLYVYILKHKNK